MTSMLQDMNIPENFHAGKLILLLETIKVVWTPHFRTMMVYKNEHDPNCIHMPISKRLSTFDASNKDVTKTLLTSPLTIKALEEVCLQMKNHVWEVSGHTTMISMMTLYFQRTHNAHKPLFLFCTKLKVERSSDRLNPVLGDKHARKSARLKINKNKNIYDPIFQLKTVPAEGEAERVLHRVKLRANQPEQHKSPKDPIKVFARRKDGFDPTIERVAKPGEIINCNICLRKTKSNHRGSQVSIQPQSRRYCSFERQTKLDFS